MIKKKVYLPRKHFGFRIIENISHACGPTSEVTHLHSEKFKADGKTGVDIYIYYNDWVEYPHGSIYGIRERYPTFVLLPLDPEKEYDSIEIKIYYQIFAGWFQFLRNIWALYLSKIKYEEVLKRRIRDPETIDKDFNSLIDTFLDFISR